MFDFLFLLPRGTDTADTGTEDTSTRSEERTEAANTGNKGITGAVIRRETVLAAGATGFDFFSARLGLIIPATTDFTCAYRGLLHVVGENECTGSAFPLFVRGAGERGGAEVDRAVGDVGIECEGGARVSSTSSSALNAAIEFVRCTLLFFHGITSATEGEVGLDDRALTCPFSLCSGGGGAA